MSLDWLSYRQPKEKRDPMAAHRFFGAVRHDIRQVPLGPMPGFAMRIPRCVVNIVVNNVRIDNVGLIDLSTEARNAVLSFGKHYCAMAFHYWTDTDLIGKEEAVAVVDYAPGGKWEDAYAAKIGDYSNHSFRVTRNRTGE